MTLALLAFGLAVSCLDRFSKTPQGKDGKQVLLKATTSPPSLDFGDQVQSRKGSQSRRSTFAFFLTNFLSTFNTVLIRPVLA
jgi:hypothetical protein